MSDVSAYERFLALHEQDTPFIMPNAWDAASAVILKQAGFEALGSTSAAIAYALGRPDVSHAVDRVEAIENARLLGQASGLPINGDYEDGFGPSPEHCVETVEAAIAAGLAGLGIEDTTANPEQPIHDFDEAVSRVAAAARAAKGRIVLTGRTDLLLNGSDDLAEVERRLVAFAEVGADVLYAPALPTMDAIRSVVSAVAPKPVNVLIGPWQGFGQLQELSDAGVRRVSVGGALYGSVMGHLERVASALRQGDMLAAVEGRTKTDFNAVFAKD